MTLAFGQNFAGLLVTRSSKRAPTHKITSCIVHRHIGFIRTMHAQHTNKLLIIARDTRQDPLNVLVTGIAQEMCKFSQLCRSIALYNTTA